MYSFLGCMAGNVMADAYTTPGQFIGNKTVVMFWGEGCGNCARQVPALMQVARYNPDVKLYVIRLGYFDDAAIPTTLPANVQVRTVEEAQATLRAFSATSSMLPFSAMISEDGAVCQSRAGVQGAATLEDWIETC